MHVKFLAHGTGSGARASAYLLGAHDHTGAERAGVTVLRGDPALFAAVADSLPFQQRYSSAVISWAAEEAPTAAEIDEVLEITIRLNAKYNFIARWEKFLHCSFKMTIFN